jgi:hypothetical protein
MCDVEASLCRTIEAGGGGRISARSAGAQAQIWEEAARCIRKIVAALPAPDTASLPVWILPIELDDLHDPADGTAIITLRDPDDEAEGGQLAATLTILHTPPLQSSGDSG